MFFHSDPESAELLLVQVCKLHYARAHALLAQVGLHRGQPPLLHALWKEDELTHSELAERLQVQPATITRMIERMERAGFLERRPDPTDRRLSRVVLSDLGRQIKTDSDRVFATMESISLRGFTEVEREQFGRYLARVRDNLLSETDEEGPCTQ